MTITICPECDWSKMDVSLAQPTIRQDEVSVIITCTRCGAKYVGMAVLQAGSFRPFQEWKKP